MKSVRLLGNGRTQKRTCLLHNVEIIISCYVICGALLVRHVYGQCSEAHRQMCSYPYLQLQALASQVTSGVAGTAGGINRLLPDYNESMMRDVCRLYSEFRNCSQPFMTSCNNHTLNEIHMYDVTLGFICGDILTDYLRNRACYQRLQTSYNACKQKHAKKFQEIDVSDASTSHTLCSASKDYVLCVYSSTALGCSMAAADVYFRLLNHSITEVFRLNNVRCQISHPMDVISIYTSTQTTSGRARTTRTITPVADTRDHDKVVAKCNSLRPLSLCYYIICLFLCLCIYIDFLCVAIA
ncbi:uncharacterized protein LOC127864663 [Dreissena polymorpha]|uniref:uncharacterized protein LOC127864663 n=1 Tax=Dreissena polymorpha TaxID=45954 RepID=UPI00226530BD|nr:uncharacterized protein LOC127864663 [Dreissena polymorpha]